MRTIDADSVTLDMPMYNSFSVGMPLEEKFRIMLERQPTVEAIPIEWIKKKINAEPPFSEEGMYWCELLDEWRKENGS